MVKRVLALSPVFSPMIRYKLNHILFIVKSGYDSDAKKQNVPSLFVIFTISTGCSVVFFNDALSVIVLSP
jgi:hypothetical protein